MHSVSPSDHSSIPFLSLWPHICVRSHCDMYGGGSLGTFPACYDGRSGGSGGSGSSCGETASVRKRRLTALLRWCCGAPLTEVAFFTRSTVRNLVL